MALLLFLSELRNKYFKIFSILISNVVNTDRYNPRKQKLWGPQ